MRNVALKIPLPALALGRLGEGCDVALARIEVLADRVDRAAFTGAVATLEQHDYPCAGDARPAGVADEFALHRLERLLVVLSLEPDHHRVSSRRNVAVTGSRRNRDPSLW
jgi:hypothetical protein